MYAPLVSFVVPCYKLAHLLRECVDSILGQTYQHIEVLIMDDCSPDDTPAVAAASEAAASPRLNCRRDGDGLLFWSCIAQLLRQSVWHLARESA